MIAWLRQVLCQLRGHEQELDWSLDGCRLFSICRQCWLPSAGWDITPKPIQFIKAPLKFRQRRTA